MKQIGERWNVFVVKWKQIRSQSIRISGLEILKFQKLFVLRWILLGLRVCAPKKEIVRLVGYPENIYLIRDTLRSTMRRSVISQVCYIFLPRGSWKGSEIFVEIFSMASISIQNVVYSSKPIINFGFFVALKLGSVQTSERIYRKLKLRLLNSGNFIYCNRCLSSHVWKLLYNNPFATLLFEQFALECDYSPFLIFVSAFSLCRIEKRGRWQFHRLHGFLTLSERFGPRDMLWNICQN